MQKITYSDIHNYQQLISLKTNACKSLLIKTLSEKTPAVTCKPSSSS